jgi:hypothetical protein
VYYKLPRGQSRVQLTLAAHKCRLRFPETGYAKLLRREGAPTSQDSILVVTKHIRSPPGFDQVRHVAHYAEAIRASVYQIPAEYNVVCRSNVHNSQKAFKRLQLPVHVADYNAAPHYCHAATRAPSPQANAWMARTPANANRIDALSRSFSFSFFTLNPQEHKKLSYTLLIAYSRG